MDSRKRPIDVALATIAGAPSRLPGKGWARHAADAVQGFAQSTRRIPANQEGPSSRLAVAGRVRADVGALLAGLQKPSEYRASGSAGESPGKLDSPAGPCALLGNRHDALNEGLRGLLETMFDAVFTACDGASLLEGAARLRPDVIVADLALVQSDGLDLIRKLRAKADEAQLIVITSHDDSNVEVAVLAAGADCVIVKRAIATDLLPAIDHMRARRTLHSSARSPNMLGRS
jgi:two-component system secretion response regulator SsrB